MPVYGVLSSGIGLWQMIEASGHEPLARRLCAATLALLTTLSIFSALDIRIDGAGADGSRSSAIETITLTPPKPPGPDRAAQSAAGIVGAPEPANAAGSMVDVSTPNSLSNPEWSVSRIRVVTTPSNRSASTAAGSANGNGTGLGGGGVYDPYAGATPMRLPGSTTGGPDIELGALALLSQRARTQGLLRDVAQCDVLVALTGAILEASCHQSDGGAANALADLVVGQRLFRPVPSVQRARIDLGR